MKRHRSYLSVMMKNRPLPDPDSLRIPRIEADANYAAMLNELAALEKRLDAARARRARAEAVQRGVSAGRSPLARAKDLLAGGTIPALDPPKEIAAADHEANAILRPAIFELNTKLADLRGDLSVIAGREVEPVHTQALREAYRALQYANVAFGVAAGIRARLRAAGFDPLEFITPFDVPPGAAVLGDGVSDGKQLQRWREHMVTRNVRLD